MSESYTPKWFAEMARKFEEHVRRNLALDKRAFEDRRKAETSEELISKLHRMFGAPLLGGMTLANRLSGESDTHDEWRDMNESPEK